MYKYITFDPAILGGKPYVKSTRLSVEFIMELFASGATREDIVKAYPQLNLDAIEEVLQYAARSVKNEIYLTAQVTS